MRFVLPPGVAITDLPVPVEAEGDAVVTSTSDPTVLLHTLTEWAIERGLKLPGLTVSRPSLEDIYLALTADAEEAS